MVLEDLLANKDNPPSKISAAVQSFFCQEYSPGGSAAESRFIRMFPMLLERILGPPTPLFDGDNLEKDIEDHSPWLFQKTKWSTRSNPLDSSPLPYGSKALDMDPVVQLLQPTSPFSTVDNHSFIQILEYMESKHHRTFRVKLPFVVIPSSMQTAYYDWLVKGATNNLAETSKSLDHLKTNSTQLWYQLNTNPIDQNELSQSLLRIQRHNKGSTGVSSFSSTSSPNMVDSSPLSGRGTKSSSFLSQSHQQRSDEVDILVPLSSSTLKKLMDMKCNVVMSLWEFYFFSFIRHPLVLTKLSKNGKTLRKSTASYHAKPYGEQVYDYLLKSYLHWYFPHNFDTSDATKFATNQATTKSNTILRIMIAFWLEGNGNYVFSTTNAAIKNFSGDVGLASSYDISSLLPIASNNYWETNAQTVTTPLKKQIFASPSKKVQSCIYHLINHLVCDPALAIEVRSSPIERKTRSLYRNDLTSRFDYKGDPSHLPWSLPTPHSIIQQSLFNYIRVMLRHGSVHDSDSVFFSTVDLWLLWLEPWNVVQCKRNVGTEVFSSISNRLILNETHIKSSAFTMNTIPKGTGKSKYSQKWDCYVAANLHFYTVPLSIFLRRAREFDLSDKLLTYVQRVFRVYSLNLVKHLDTLIDTPGKYCLIVKRHEDLLGEYCPPLCDELSKCNRGLTSLRVDMHSLLEEICLSHQKTVRERGVTDKIESFIESFFIEGTMRGDKTISQLIEAANVIVSFPKGYSVLKQYEGGNSKSTDTLNRQTNIGDSLSPERGADGLLTENGRYQLVLGTKQCHKLDSVVYGLGDPMYSRVKSYEVALIVRMSINISTWLNEHLFGQVLKDSIDGTSSAEGFTKLFRQAQNRRNIRFRINLRFLADCRLLAFIFLVSFVLALI